MTKSKSKRFPQLGLNCYHTCAPRARRRRVGVADKARLAPASADIASNVREVLSVASRIAEMPDREVLDRYHALVDKQLITSLTLTERFELERIEARLDANDRDPLVEARNREWEAERIRILDSIQSLIAKLQH